VISPSKSPCVVLSDACIPSDQAVDLQQVSLRAIYRFVQKECGTWPFEELADLSQQNHSKVGMMWH